MPVVSYLSGGVDSSLIVAMANKALGRPIPTFTVSVKSKGLDEESEALQVARSTSAASRWWSIAATTTLRTDYPELIAAAEFPVIDTSCLGLMHLASSVHQHGYKVALTGEGADEWLAGLLVVQDQPAHWLDGQDPGAPARLRPAPADAETHRPAGVLVQDVPARATSRWAGRTAGSTCMAS